MIYSNQWVHNIETHGIVVLWHKHFGKYWQTKLCLLWCFFHLHKLTYYVISDVIALWLVRHSATIIHHSYKEREYYIPPFFFWNSQSILKFITYCIILKFIKVQIQDYYYLLYWSMYHKVLLNKRINYDIVTQSNDLRCWNVKF